MENESGEWMIMTVSCTSFFFFILFLFSAGGGGPGAGASAAHKGRRAGRNNKFVEEVRKKWKLKKKIIWPDLIWLPSARFWTDSSRHLPEREEGKNRVRSVQYQACCCCYNSYVIVAVVSVIISVIIVVWRERVLFTLDLLLSIIILYFCNMVSVVILQ